MDTFISRDFNLLFARIANKFQTVYTTILKFGVRVKDELYYVHLEGYCAISNILLVTSRQTSLADFR